MIQNVIFGIIFLKILFWAYNFYTFVHTCQWTSSEFFSKPTKTNKKNPLVLQYSFSQNTSFILWTSTHLTLKIVCSDNTAKILSEFTNFSANIFLFNARESICTAPFLDAQELHSWSTLKENVCMFLDISVRKCLFERRSKIFSGGGWVVGGED